MTRQNVNSSSVVSLGYDAMTFTLEVEHKSGVYRSSPVTSQEFQETLAAPSIGRAVNELRKKAHVATTRVEEAEVA